MSREELAWMVLVVAVVLVAVLVAGGERKKVWIDEATLDPHDPYLLPTPDGREHGLDDPAPRVPGLRRDPGRVRCSS